MVTIQRTPYEHGDAVIDVASELEKLRAHYAELQNEKKLKEKKAMDKAMKARPSPVQLRLYNEGVDKMSALKMCEEFEKKQDEFAPNVRSASPSPICDRLYAEGMAAKVLSNLSQDVERKQRVPPSPQSRRKITSSPVCDRLYQEGLSQVARNSSRARSNSLNKPPSIRSSSPSPNPTCDRLYEQGMDKIRSTSQTRGRDNTPLSQDEKLRKLAASPSKRSNSIDRMYEYGKAKLRATSRSNSSRTRTAEKGNAKLHFAPNSRLPPPSTTSPYKVSRGRSPPAASHDRHGLDQISDDPEPTREDSVNMGLPEMKIGEQTTVFSPEEPANDDVSPAAAFLSPEDPENDDISFDANGC